MPRRWFGICFRRRSWGLGAVLSLFMLATYATVYRTLRFMSTRRLLSLLTAAAMLMPLLLPPTTATPSFTLHAVLALAAYVAAACAFLHWLDLRTAERLLRRRPQITFSPPLLNDERWCFRHVGAAFVLLTLTLVSGFLAQPDDFSLTHKNLFALLTWLTFLALLLGRRLFGWRGKAAQLWFFVGYVFLLLSYIGSTFVLQFILGRG